MTSGLILVFVISFITFTFLIAGGGDIGRRLLGENATAEAVANKTTELGLDQPLLVQYTDWLTSALSADFGRSWFSGQPVADAIASRMGVTLSLAVGAVIVGAVVAVTLGILAARRGGWVDGVIQCVSLIGVGVPAFLFAILLVLVFALTLGWFRATGFTPMTSSFGGWAGSVTLPIAALSFGIVASVSQQVRGAVLDGMSRDYVRTLRSRGLPERSVIYKHVLRNAAGPALTILALSFMGMLGGAVIVEQMFAIPGLGQLAIPATNTGDVPVVMGVVVYFAIIVVAVNLVIDLAQAALNPKVRLS
jgi:peptide/nickel transport system permease protein